MNVSLLLSYSKRFVNRTSWFSNSSRRLFCSVCWLSSPCSYCRIFLTPISTQNWTKTSSSTYWNISNRIWTKYWYLFVFRFQLVQSFLSTGHSGLNLLNFWLKILNLLIEALDGIKNFGYTSILWALDIFFIVMKSILKSGDLCLQLMEKWFFTFEFCRFFQLMKIFLE